MDVKTKGPLPLVILDEIALEGLEGISISGLWTRLSETLERPLPLLPHFQNQVWSFVRSAGKYLFFYELPEPREELKIFDRMKCVDPELGLPTTNFDECPYTRYKRAPIDDYPNLGSCEFYKEKKSIPTNEVENMSLEEVLQRWDKKFVIVGTQELRYNSLIPINMPIPKDLTSVQYCCLEAIGRSRYNGETTAGNFSLLYWCKDSTIVFYIRNKLERCGAIEKQTFPEKRADRIHFNTLLTLPRFSTTRKTFFECIIEKIFTLVKESPNKRLPLQHIKSAFPSSKKKTIQKIFSTNFFQKIFNIKNQPAGEFAELLKMNPSTKKEVLVIELKNSDMTETELFADDVVESEKEIEDNNFFSENHSFLDMTLLEKIYRGVLRFGERGCSQSELASYISMNHYNIRLGIKSALAEGIIISRVEDRGRQRTNIFVAANIKLSTKQKETQSEVAVKLECDPEPNIPVEPDAMLRDISTISSRIKQYKVEHAPLKKPQTQRQYERQSKIIRALDEFCIAQTTQMRVIITKSELEQGYKDEICQKSLRRIFGSLQNQGLINTYEVVLQSNESVRLYRFITHPKIDINHKVIKNEIIKLKHKFFQQLEEQKARSKSRSCQDAIKISDKELLPLCFKTPKLLVSRFLHEFLFYISRELLPSTLPKRVNEEMVRMWQQTEPSIDTKSYLESLKNEGIKISAYTENIDWRTFIPPLAKYEDNIPRGWVYILDAIDRIPLSVFWKMFQLDKICDSQTKEYASHPIRQHYLIKQLPIDLQAQISGIRTQQMYKTIVTVLNNMGLVQLGGRDNKHVWIYLNRKATILDTTTAEAAYKKINPSRKYTKISYEFNSLEDVRQYWINLHKICLHTKLGFKSKISNKTSVSNRIDKECMPVIPVVKFVDAPSIDNGRTPGDNLGAGGLPSGMYAHLLKKWSMVSSTSKTPNLIRIGKRRTKVGNAGPQKNSTATKKTIIGIINKNNQILKKRALWSKKISLKDGFDSIDKDALKNMSSIRVSWLDSEDQVLKMCRVIYEYLSVPVIILNLRTVAKSARDIIRQHLNIKNKTSITCLRRLSFLIKNNRHLPEVPEWLNLLQKDPYMIEHYGNSCYRKLTSLRLKRIENSSIIRVHLILIFIRLLKILYSTDNELEKITNFIIPNTLNEFYKKYTEKILLAENPTLSQSNPDNLIDVQIAIVNNVLHSSLCCNRDKTHYNLQIFNIYKFYSDDVLSLAFKKSHDDGLVVNMKHRSLQKQHVGGPAYLFSNRYRQRLIFLKIPYFVYDQCYQFLNNVFKMLFVNNSEQNLKQNNIFEFKSSNSGALFAIGECAHLDYFSLNIKFPTSILTVDPSSQSIGDPDSIMYRFHHIFKNAPQTEYLKQYEIENGENNPNEKRVKFKMANHSYKIYYNPYDIISKMNNRSLHFFCALNSLNKQFDINRCRTENECPFECILNCDNYINTIKAIVDSKTMEISELFKNDNQNQLNKQETEIETTTILRIDNFMSVIRNVESILLEIAMPNELKDFGKRELTLKKIDWSVLCKELMELENIDDDFSKHDEYEPTLDKEERIARANDVLVVNLPTISLTISEELTETSEIIKFKDISVPKVFVETILLREKIFEKISKEACWTYTENTWETLQSILDQKHYSIDERVELKSLLDFIESKVFGVSALDILNKFSNEKFLLRGLAVLREHYLIKRVGVASFMYVHKSHVRQWVVHTCHIKRLDREAMGSMNVKINDLKRKHILIEDEDDDGDEIASKITKRVDEFDDDVLSEDKPSTSKRVSKPPERYEEPKKVITSSLPSTNDVIVLTPCPWIRVNGALNRRVLDRLLGTVLNESIAYNGISVFSFCMKFRQIQPVNTIFLLELLSDMQCIKLKQFNSSKVDLFSSYRIPEESVATELTDPKKAFIIVLPGAVMRLSMFIGDKKYTSEYI